jgi:hypothetical protein
VLGIQPLSVRQIYGICAFFKSKDFFSNHIYHILIFANAKTDDAVAAKAFAKQYNWLRCHDVDN